MDETKETTQDTSLEKETSLEGSEGTTPNKETFTEAEVDKRIQADRVARGRDAKALETREAVIKAQEDANKAAGLELERMRIETQRKEIEALADDPEAKKALLRRYDADKRERDLDEREKNNREAIERMFNNAEALATEHNLKPSDLLIAKTPEEMKLLAKNLALEREVKAKQTKEGFPKPDSNTSDAAPTGDFKQLRDNFIKDPFKYGKAYKDALIKRGQ